MNLLQSLDRTIFFEINSLHAIWLNPIMVFTSGMILWIPVIIFILWKSRSSMEKRGFYIFLIFLVLTLIVSDTCSSSIIKNIFTRLRPCRLPEINNIIYRFGQKCGGKYGFVSSHACNSMALITFSFLSLKLSFRKHGWIWIFPIVVGWSRIYLGVHYPGDILGGYLVGSLCGLLFYSLFLNVFKVQAAGLTNQNLFSRS